MAIFSGPDEIYKKLVEDSEESWLYGLVAFAVIEEQRIEWVRHLEEHRGEPPSQEEVKSWYEQQPEAVLLRAKGTAENALKAYSDEVVEIVLDDHRKEIEEGIFLNEIRNLKAFWPQFGVNLAGGFISALLFALFLAIMAFFVLTDLSPVEIASEVKQQLEVNDHAKTGSDQ
ncbi:MAG: hypothetical protein MI756_14105 [Chromatiales bacterium]|nr:hypothetical protein [Chromatiales bacterium]